MAFQELVYCCRYVDNEAKNNLGLGDRSHFYVPVC